MYQWFNAAMSCSGNGFLGDNFHMYAAAAPTYEHVLIIYTHIKEHKHNTL